MSKTALKLAHKAPTPPSLNDARAERETAERALAVARAAVQAQVDRWPAPSNDRRWLSQMFTGPRPANDYALDPEGRATLERLADFRKAVESEGEAECRFDVAVKVEAEAIRLAFGDGRGALADALLAARARVAEANAARATAERARGAMVKASAAEDQARVALDEAKERAIHASSTDGAVVDLKALRRAAADAADDLEIAVEAVRRAEAAMEEPEYQEGQARRAAEDAARAVLAADTSQRLAALEAMVAEFQARAIVAAAYLAATAPRSFSYGSEEARVRMFADARLQELIHLGRPDPSNHYAQQRAGLDLHASTLAALMLDAAAPVPEMPHNVV